MPSCFEPQKTVDLIPLILKGVDRRVLRRTIGAMQGTS